MSGNQGNLPSPATILKRLAKTHEVNDKVSSDAEVRETHTEDIDITVTESIEALEEFDQRKYTLSEFSSAKKKRTAMKDRYNKAPDLSNDQTSTPRNKKVEFIDKKASKTQCNHCGGSGDRECATCHGNGKETCSKCDGGSKVSCSSCRNGRAQCDQCGGSGSVSHKENRQCARCAGRGNINCLKCHGNDNNCSKCSGGGTIDCPDCKGSGTTTVSIEESCRNCNGEGRVHCSRCDGKGTVPCSKCDATGTVTCSKCGGDGTVTCSVCDGKGKIIKANTGKIKFSYSQEFTAQIDEVPKDHIEPEDGTIQDERWPIRREKPDQGHSDTFDRRIRSRVATARHIVYDYDGDEYSITYVAPDDALRYGDFPPDPEFVSEAVDNATASIPRGDAFNPFQEIYVLSFGLVIGLILLLGPYFFFSPFGGDGPSALILLGICGTSGYLMWDRYWESETSASSTLKLAGLRHQSGSSLAGSSDPTTRERYVDLFKESEWNHDASLSSPSLELLTPVIALAAVAALWVTDILNLLVSLVLASMTVGWLALRVSGLLGALSTTFTVRKETIDHICDGLDVDEQFLKANTDMSRFEVTTGLMSANSYQSLSKLVGLFGAGSAVVVAATYLLFVLFPNQGVSTSDPQTLLIAGLAIPFTVTIIGLIPGIIDYRKL